jgi:uncharacterized protein YggU (UPF0235/DUF167 family)
LKRKASGAALQAVSADNAAAGAATEAWPWLTSRSGTCRLTVTVVPQASRTGLGGLHAGTLRVRLAAEPIDGKANEALIDWLSRTLGVPKRAVHLLHGASSRRKQLDIDLDAATAAQRLRKLLA